MPGIRRIAHHFDGNFLTGGALLIQRNRRQGLSRTQNAGFSQYRSIAGADSETKPDGVIFLRSEIDHQPVFFQHWLSTDGKFIPVGDLNRSAGNVFRKLQRAGNGRGLKSRWCKRRLLMRLDHQYGRHDNERKNANSCGTDENDFFFFHDNAPCYRTDSPCVLGSQLFPKDRRNPFCPLERGRSFLRSRWLLNGYSDAANFRERFCSQIEAG